MRRLTMLDRAVRWTLLFCIPLLLFSCTKPAEGEHTDTPPSFDYAAALSEYAESALHVRTALSCRLGDHAAEAGAEISEQDGEYTALMRDTAQCFSCDKDQDTTAFFARACYLPPFDTELYGAEGKYTASLDGEQARSFLLSASALFTGYAENGGVSLAEPCTYTVNAREGKIVSYSYEFALNVNDGAEEFSAQITIMIEVLN